MDSVQLYNLVGAEEVKVENGEIPSNDPAIATLLDEFKDVFTEPRDLLPPRAHDHWIPL